MNQKPKKGKEPHKRSRGRGASTARATSTESMKPETQEGEERFRQLIEYAPDAVFIADAATGDIVGANAAASRLLGMPRERIIGLHFTRLHPARLEQYVRSRFKEQAGQTDARAGARSFETLVLKSDGTEVQVDISAQSINLQTRRLLVGIFRDITRRVRMEQELRETERRYHTLLESVNLIAVMLNREGEITFCNQFLLDLSGWKIEQVLRKNWFDMFFPEARDKEILLRAVKSGEFPAHYENAIRTRSGEQRLIRWNNTVLRDLNGAVVGAASIGEDITDRKRAEEALRGSEEKYKNLVELSSDIIYRSDARGNQTFMNDAAFRVLECSPGEVIGEPWLKWIHSEDRDRSCRTFQDMIEKGADVFSFENRYVSKSGRKIPVLHNVRVLRNERGDIVGTQGIARDLSERKKTEEELLKSQKLESIGTLAGGIAHDFNNLLMAIMGNISLAKLYTGHAGKAHRLLSEAEAACDQARDLSYRLLTFSKGGEPVRQAVSLPDILRDAATFALSGSNVLPKFDFESGLSPVEADVGQLKQVVYNLVFNAREAMPEGGAIAIGARNVLSPENENLPLAAGAYVAISVKDQGAGIPKEHLDKIFDPYFSTREMGSQRGRGLGLAICHSIVQKHGGLITVESAVGSGTEFHVYLPLRTRVQEHETGHVKTDAELPAAKNSGRLLVMDDEEKVRQVAREMLTFLGYDVETAADGNEAAEAYRKAAEKREPFDCVILDLTVPGGAGGIDALKKLRDMDPRVCAIVSTGYAEDAIMTSYPTHGFAGALAKPYRLDQVDDLLKNVLLMKKKDLSS